MQTWLLDPCLRTQSLPNSNMKPYHKFDMEDDEEEEEGDKEEYKE